MNPKEYAKKKVKKKIKRTGLNLAKVIVLRLGVPTIIAGICFIIVVSGIATHTQKNLVALSEATRSSGNTTNSIEHGKATYVGVDDTDTDISRAVLRETNKFSDRRNPFLYGYRGLCEQWVCDIYSKAGLKSYGTCCAFRHGKNRAQSKGKIPKGAMVFSGYKPDGSFYENGHRPGTFCDVCNSWAGHVGIYMGNGVIVGSQIPYRMSVDSWIDTFGYGGWSFG